MENPEWFKTRMTLDQVIRKVKALLALATSSNENEARAAMQKAQKLIEEYNLDLNRINPLENQIQRVLYISKERRYGIQKWEPQLINIVSLIFGSFVTVSKAGINIVGFQTNITIIQHAIDVVIHQGIESYRIEYKKYRTITFSDGFWAGFILGFKEKFKDEIKSSKENPLYTEIFEQRAQLKVYNTSLYSDYGFETGVKHGKEVELRKGVSGTSIKGQIA